MTQDNHNSQESEERRIARRYQLNLPIDIDGKPATSINISATGIRYISPQPLNKGASAYLKVYFGKNRVNLVGKTVWAEELGSGAVVGATFAAGSDTERLERYLERCQWKLPV